MLSSHALVAASLIGIDIAQRTTAAVPLTYVNSAQTLAVAGLVTYAETIARPFVEDVSSTPIVQVMPRQYAEAAGIPQCPSFMPVSSVTEGQPRARPESSLHTKL